MNYIVKYRDTMENEQSAEDYIEIADKIRSGEYFRDARAMYDIDVHSPMSDRYWYLFITLVSLIITVVAIVAWLGFFPLNNRVPFIFATNNILDDYPRVKSLLNYRGENPNTALQRYLAQNYVRLREEYDASLFDRSHNAVLSLSTKEVAKEYERDISPLNPESPITLYQRHTIRAINIIGSQPIEDETKKKVNGVKEYRMLVTFEDSLVSGEQENPHGRYQVDIAFMYKDIKLDTITNKIEPYGFIVTSYHIKSL